jgi:small subunit ribosomal protein S6
MVYYETMYIVHPALEAGRLKDLILSIESSLNDLGGKTKIIEVWGKKKLAYPINKEKYGMYVLLQFESDGSKNKEFNTALDHNTNVLAYLTTKIDTDQLLSDVGSLDNQLGLLNKNESAGTASNNSKNAKEEPVDSKETEAESSEETEAESSEETEEKSSEETEEKSSEETEEESAENIDSSDSDNNKEEN